MNEQNLSSKPSQCPDDLWNLIQTSLNSEPNHRLTFKEIDSELSKILKLLQINQVKEKQSLAQEDNENDVYFSN